MHWQGWSPAPPFSIPPAPQIAVAALDLGLLIARHRVDSRVRARPRDLHLRCRDDAGDQADCIGGG